MLPMRRGWLAGGIACAAFAATAPAFAQSYDPSAIWGVRARPAPSATPIVRPEPPGEGRRRCIAVDRVAGAVVLGDRAVELSMANGRRWRLYLEQDCPTLSFYQGFYYRRGRAGMLCAGRDAVIARSGGECAIASITPVGPPPRKRRRR